MEFVHHPTVKIVITDCQKKRFKVINPDDSRIFFWNVIKVVWILFTYMVMYSLYYCLFLQFFNILLCLSAPIFGYSQPIDFRNSRKYDWNWKNPFSFWQNRKFYTSPAPEKSDYPIYYVGEPEPIIIKTKMGTLGSLLSAKYM